MEKAWTWLVSFFPQKSRGIVIYKVFIRIPLNLKYLLVIEDLCAVIKVHKDTVKQYQQRRISY